MRANPFESQLERLARTLTEQFGVKVICQGDNAWTDGRQIVLPSLPEPLEENLERMMVGYLDHEMAHVAFSDFKVGEEFAGRYPGYEGLLNTIEDALIERRAMDRWPGVRANLDAMFAQIRGRVAQLIQQRGPFDRFCTAVYLKLSHHRDLVGLDRELVGYEDLLARFPQIRTTREAGELAELLLQRWQQRATQRQKQQHDSSGAKAERQNPRGQADEAAQVDGGSEGTSPRGGPRPDDADLSPSQHSDSGQQCQDDTKPASSEGPLDHSAPASDDRVPQCRDRGRGSEAQPEPSGRKSASTDSGRPSP